MMRRLRQFFCMHDWSCGWSHLCMGDHYCLKCGKQGSAVSEVDGTVEP